MTKFMVYGKFPSYFSLEDWQSSDIWWPEMRIFSAKYFEMSDIYCFRQMERKVDKSPIYYCDKRATKTVNKKNFPLAYIMNHKRLVAFGLRSWSAAVWDKRCWQVWWKIRRHDSLTSGDGADSGGSRYECLFANYFPSYLIVRMELRGGV